MRERPPGAAQDTAQAETVVDRPRRRGEAVGLAPGLAIRHYEIIREIGRGGMGQVYLARDTRLDRLVAMKFIATQDRDLAERFIVEARATARCTHENIVVIHEVDSHEGMPYMVLEYLEGEPLVALLQRSGRLAPARAVELMIPAVRALERAHALGIVHRDLKLENIFVTRTGQVKVLDFGVAKVLDDDDRNTAVGAWVGTPAYMAPEQLGMDSVDGQADLWACGIILHAMLSGRHPLGDGSAEVVVSALMDLDLPMPRLAAVAPDVPIDVARIVDSCLAKRKADRWASARALLDALSRSATAPSDAAPSVRSVAVLPFHNGGAAEDAYLAEGLTEDLIDTLSMTKGLRLKPRSATRRYTGEVDHAAVGAALDVQVLVEGSVRRHGDGLRITARVVSVTDCFQEWTKRFECPAGDALRVSDEVAAALAEALTMAPPAARPAGSDPIAVDLYLRGRAALRGLDRASAEHAVDLLGQAQGRAPDDPTILAAGARAGARMLFFRSDPTVAQRALALARRAVAAAPHSGEVELALAQVHFALGAYVDAATHAARAVRRAPFLADAHAMIGRVRVEVGPLERGRGALDRALALDPELHAARH
ncbi:MAG TPA: serine/threonine-protein kinase, partial [Kofleriaceae bacterium]|nr:serine/threonine-protein kinase [Kofleriaceae bacterium]